MSSDERPSWARALDLLEQGERERAEAVLADAENDDAVENEEAVEIDEPLEDEDVVDRWMAALLRATLTHATLPEEALTAPHGQEDRDGVPVGHALAAGLRAAQAIREGRVADAARHAEAAADRTPDASLWLRVRAAALFQAVFRFSGQPEDHDRAITIAAAVADRIESPRMAVTARGVLGTIHLVAGHFHACLERCDSAIELAAATGLEDDSCVALAHQFRGYVLFEWNRLEEARVELERAWALTGPSARGVRSGVARMLAAVAAARGDAEGARRWLDRLEEIVSEPMTLRNREWLAAVRALHGVEGGPELRRIDMWRRSFDYDADALAALPDPEARAKLHEHEHLLTLLEATSQWDAMLAVARVLARGAGESRRWFAVRALTAEAAALEASGFGERADEAWLAALRLGEPGGYVRAYVDGGAARRTLLRRSLDREETRPLARRVAEACSGLLDDASERLTPRQQDALELVSRGLSNREIAKTMGVSETTVRTHLREVFARLGVRSRTHAVAEARRLGLLTA